MSDSTTGPRSALPQRRGMDLLHDPRSNKGTAFTRAERDLLGLCGLLPPSMFSEAAQVDRNIESLRHKSSDLEAFIRAQIAVPTCASFA